MLLWCLGMHASASTWAYNVVQKVAATAMPGLPITTTFATDALPQDNGPPGVLVVKSHALEHAARMQAQAHAIIITIRDPRDAVASLMRHHHADFDLAFAVTAASAWTCAAVMASPRALLLKYEDLFFDEPATVDRIAGCLGMQVAADDSARIFSALGRDAVEQFIAGLQSMPTAEKRFDEMTGQWEVYDPVSGWRTHHAGRRGEVGRWRRELSVAQVQHIEHRMRPWMARFGYVSDLPRQRTYRLSIGPYKVAV